MNLEPSPVIDFVLLRFANFGIQAVVEQALDNPGKDVFVIPGLTRNPRRRDPGASATVLPIKTLHKK